MKRVIVAVVLLFALGVGITLWVRSRRRRDDSEADRQTVQVERGTVELTVSADGVLKPLTTVMVKSYAGGRIDMLAVEVGDEVQARQLIAKIDPTDSRTAHEQALADLHVAQARRAQAQEQAQVQPTLTQAGIDQAEASYKATLQDLERLKQAGQPQARVQARGALDKAEASLDSAQKDRESLQQAGHPQARAQALATLNKARASLGSAQKDLESLQQAGQPQARAQAFSALEKAKANLEVADKELARARGLKEQGYVPQGEVDTAVSRQALANADLAAAQQRWDTLDMEQSAELRAAQARVDQAKADLAAAEPRWDTLATQQAAELRVAQARVDQAKADLASAQERWNTLDAEQTAELRAAQARVDQAKAGVDRAQADTVQDRLRQADLTSAQAQVARAQSQLENAKTMLDYTTIRAPRAGVILQKLAEEGTIITSGRSTIGQGTDIVELGDLTKMFVEVNMDEVDVSSIRVEQPVVIRVDALPDEEFGGVVTRVNPQAASEQNITTVLVTVQVQKPDARFKPGMTATCDFLVRQVEGVLYLPRRAVQDMGGKHMVAVVQGEQTVHTPVKVGIVGDERSEILEGLDEGAEVVMHGLMGQSEDRTDWMRRMGRRAAGGGGFVRGSR